MARPTKYKEQYVEQARFLAEQFGATDEQLARALGISDATLYHWKRDHAEFLEAVLGGKRKFDTEHVEKSILACALGYWYQDEKYDSESGQIIRLWHYRHPDPKAWALWMANRQGWRLPAPAGAFGPAPALPAAVGNELPPGGEPEAALDAAAQARLNELARELLETRHGTRIRVASRTVTAEDAEKAQDEKKGQANDRPSD